MSATFDLDGYLARVGCPAVKTPDLVTLRALHAGHQAAIPFENLDPFLRRPVRLDLPALQAKLVAGRRGGYCFEQNILLAAALESLGFSVRRLAGRVRWMAPPGAPDGPRTHMLLRVDLDEGPYLADVGFGTHLLAAPIKLERDIEQPTPTGVLRLIGADQTYTLQTPLPEGWQDVYRFTLEPQLPADYELANWYTATNPASRFCTNLLAARLTAEEQISLFNTRLTRRFANGGAEARTLADAGELADALEAAFAIIPPVDPAEIWARLPKS